MEKNEVTTYLKNALKQTGRPISWAAKEANVSYVHFHDVLNGRRNLSSGMKKKIENLISKMNEPLVS